MALHCQLVLAIGLAFCKAVAVVSREGPSSKVGA